MRYDILIVGGSVAGLCAGIELARAGIKTAIFERKPAVGFPVQCAEFVPYAFGLATRSFMPFVAREIRGLKTIVDDHSGKTHTLYSDQRGFVLNRGMWERHLAAQAVLAGAQLFVGEAVVEIEFAKDRVIAKTPRRTAEAQIIIGADGPISITSIFAGVETQKVMPAIQYILPLKLELSENIVIFSPEIRGGYAWIFPKGEVANGGIGAWGVSRKKLDEIVRRFAEILAPSPIETVGGLIPVYGMREKVAGERYILVGDAAGLTDPITGAGIASAWESATIAAKTAADFLAGKINSLTEYERRIRFLRRAVERSLHRRIEMERRWDDEQNFFETIRENWIPSRIAGSAG